MKKKLLSSVSIKWKIFGYLLCFCGLLLVVLWLFQVVFLEQFYRQIKIQSVYSTARSMESALEKENLTDSIDTLAKNGSLCAAVLDADGKVVSLGEGVKDSFLYHLSDTDRLKLLELTRQYDNELLRYVSSSGRSLKLTYGSNSTMVTDVIELNPDVPNFQKKEGGRPQEEFPPMVDNVPLPQTDFPFFGFFDNGESGRMRERSIVLSKLVTVSDGSQRLLLVNAVVTPVSATVEALRVQLFWITGIMLLFSVVLALVISRNVSAPMEAISKKAQILAGGDYGVEFHQAGYLEIRQLSDTLTKMSQDLSKVEALRRELIANISHDLRTPLTLIEGYAEVMRDLPNENTPENAQIILDETKRLATLVADTLDLSKLQAGAVPMNMDALDLGELLTTVTHPLSEMLKTSGYQIGLDIPKSPVMVRGDATRLGQAFYNLLINAVNYTGADKRVTVGLVCRQGVAEVSVTDSGDGIAAEDLPYIWDRYYKASKAGKTHRRGVTGTGLGLSIVKSIFEQHGCDYGVESESGKGSRFWFTIGLL